jgi:hypothetical protein
MKIRDPQEDRNGRQVKEHIEHRYSEQNPCLRNPDPTTRLTSKEISYDLRKLPHSEYYSTLRYLLAKIEFEGRLSNRESLAMTLCFDELWSYSDKSWVQKFGTHLVRMKFLIECYQRICKTGSDVQERFRLISRGYQYRKFLHQPNAYFGRKISFNLKRILVRINRKLKRESSVKRFIGVGYRDAGNARNTALDGSPSWQDVSSSKCPISKDKPTKQWTGPELAILSNWGEYPERLALVTRE